MPSRRRFLAACATGATVALAGCAGPDVAMFAERVEDDRSIASRATLALESAAPDAKSHLETLPDRYAPLVADAVDGGTEVEDDRAPLQVDRPVVYEDVPYDVTWSVVGERTRTEFAIAATAGAAADVQPEVHVDDLPEADRETIEALRPARVAELASEDGGAERRQVQRYYDGAEREQSVLVPEPEYDVLDTEHGPIEIEVQSVEAQRQVYRYEAEALAPSLSAFGGELRSAHEFALEDLSETEREFFESVVEDGSYYDTEPEGGFEGVADRLVAEPALFVRDREGEWLVSYDGETYWVRVDFVRMADYAERIELADGPANVSGSSRDR